MYKPDDALKALGEQVIERTPRFADLNACCIAYLRSTKPKSRNGQIVYADCHKVAERECALCGYDFIITFYKDSIELSERAAAILMEHELTHIGFHMKEDGTTIKRIVPHDLEDFRAIIDRYGADWLNT